MAHSAPAFAAPSTRAPAFPGFKRLLTRIGAFLEALDGDHFAAPEVRIQRLEQRVAQLESAAARREG
ncbi:hypothetical protein [Novosphingobium sp.]|uniref:hypothetical protein n=1 Tax=Novosphingobium sp. TaxID=1874826 RepID=UPI003BAB6B16